MLAAWWEWLGLDLSVALVNAEQNPCQSINCCRITCPNRTCSCSIILVKLYQLFELFIYLIWLRNGSATWLDLQVVGINQYCLSLSLTVSHDCLHQFTRLIITHVDNLVCPLSDWLA